MPKRKITEVKEHGVFGIYPLLREEYKAYEAYKEEAEKLKTVPPEELVHETASLFVRRSILEGISNSIDGAIEESRQPDAGETQADDEMSPAYRQASDALVGMDDKITFEALHGQEIKNLENNVARLYEEAGTDEPLPIDFLVVAYQPDLDDDAIKYYVGLYKEGKPLFEGDVSLESRLTPDEPETEVEEVKEEEKEEVKEEKEDEKKEEEKVEDEKKEEEKKEDEKVEEKAEGNNGGDNGQNDEGEAEAEEEKKEEKLTEDQVRERREKVDGAVKNFFQKVLDVMDDPLGALEELGLFGLNPYLCLKIAGQNFLDLYKDVAAIEDPVERNQKLKEALDNELSGDKQITFDRPEVLTDGKVVPGNEVVIKESKENLQALADNQQKYNILLNQQLQELNLLKEEFGKTQDLPKANFDGKNIEGSDYYQKMTSSLQHCISIIEDMQSGKKTYAPGVLEGAYNQFKQDCETYVENRKGRFFGPVTDNGKTRISLGRDGANKVDRLSKELNQYTDKITSKVIVDADGKTFDRGLNVKEQNEYIQKLKDTGKVEIKPDAEVEHEICLEQLKKIQTLDYALKDYSADKNGKYKDAARQVIIGIHNDILIRGQKATNYDVNRIRNYDISLKNMADSPVFRTIVDKEGIDAAKKKWPAIEQRTDALRNSIQEDQDKLLADNKTVGEYTYNYNVSVSEYVAGLRHKENRPEIDQGHTPESKISQFEVNDELLDQAYDRMTKVITNKLLLENDKFGREFLNAQAANLIDNEATPDGKKPVTNTFDMTVNDVDVRTQLNSITKQLLVQNHVLEGKKLPKALKQLESGKLSEDLVNSVKEVYKNEKNKNKTQELNIKAEDLSVEQKMDDKGLTRSAESQEIVKMQNEYIHDANEQANTLNGNKGYIKDGVLDQEKIQTIIKVACAGIVSRNRNEFPTKESIEKFEKSFYQKDDVKMGILILADKYSVQQIKEMTQSSAFKNNLKDEISKAKVLLDKKFEPLSEDIMNNHKDIVAARYKEVKEVDKVKSAKNASKELKLPEHLKNKAPEHEIEKNNAPVM
jgi:hypothetical protein